MSKASSNSEGRWLWVPPALILLGFAAFGIHQLAPKEEQHPNRQERLGERASALCHEHVPPGHELGMFSPVTAGELVRAARFLGERSAAPWDQVPADHFVVRCSYTSPNAVASAPTTICPNGDIVNLSRPTQILLDEDGRTSPDYASGRLIPSCP